MSLKSTAIMFISAACAAPIFADEAPTARKTDAQRPNILFIITDDHAVQAMGTCEKDSPIAYPHFNKLAKEGMVFDRSYCANSLCGPSRACILTGRHSHKNGYIFNEGRTPFDGSQPTYPKMLQQAGYQTAIFGKWHLESDPTGFDHWEIFLTGRLLQSRFHFPRTERQAQGDARRRLCDRPRDEEEHRLA